MKKEGGHTAAGPSDPLIYMVSTPPFWVTGVMPAPGGEYPFHRP